MRTLTTEYLDSKIVGKKKYYIVGVLSIIMTDYRREPDVYAIKKEIKEIDAEFPWKDNGCYSEKEFKSISCFSGGKVFKLEGTTPETSASIQVSPMLREYSSGEVDAYEKYVARIARELVTRLEWVGEARSSIGVHSAPTSFKK